jgi:hypothetical protein
MTTLMTADTLENSTLDTWNHPKIPRLQALEEAEERNETNRDWYTVDLDMQHTYASLGGINVIHLSGMGATNLTVPYEYMYFGCDLSPHNNLTRWFNNKTNAFEVESPWLGSQLRYLNSLNDAVVLESGNQFQKNATQLSPTTSNNPGTVVSSSRSFFIYTRLGNTTATKHKPQGLIYGSNSIVSTSFWLFECSMRSVIVEANIICDKATCVVDRLRRLNRLRSERNAPYLPYDVVHEMYTNRYLMRHLLAVGGENSNFRPNPVDAYIYGHSAWAADEIGMGPRKDWRTYVNDTDKMRQMSHRMTRFLNTFWDASRWPIAMTRNDPFAKTSLNETSGLPPRMLTMDSTNATISQQVLVYRANAGWVASLVLCSCVLLLLGIYSFFLSLFITAPDIFDYVSSFTRDNPHIETPAGGSALDGAERARLLRKLPVQLGDTDQGAETGYIALRSADRKQDFETGRVRRDRMYR